MEQNEDMGTISVKVVADTSEFDESIDKMLTKLGRATSLLKKANREMRKSREQGNVDVDRDENANEVIYAVERFVCKTLDDLKAGKPVAKDVIESMTRLAYGYMQMSEGQIRAFGVEAPSYALEMDERFKEAMKTIGRD